MDRFMFWQRGLVVLSLLIIVAGVGMALLSGTALFDVLDNQVNPVFWDSKTVSGDIEEFQQWVYGLLGATMAGWGVFLAFVAAIPFKRRERWAWTCIAAGLTLWFVIDTAISIYWGVYFNAFVVNTPLFVLAMLPLIFTRRAFAA